MEITTERYAELIISEHNHKKLCAIIKEKADSYDTLDSQELRILRDMICSVQGQTEAE